MTAACVLICACLLGPSASEACDDQTVRGAAFNEPRDQHRLCVIGTTGDLAADRTYQRLQSWLHGDGRGLNLELIRVAADSSGMDWQEFGIPSTPPVLPVVVLAGRRTAERRSFFIDHWDPAPTDPQLELLRTSPARQALQRELGKRLAVLLYIPGTDPASNAAESAIDAAAKTWSAKGSLGVTVVRADRTDTRERLLLSFAGVRPKGPDWLAVVFGRGKFMLPLTGDQITEAGIGGCLSQLVEACTCLRSPSTLGVDVPMVWDDALDAAVEPFKPDTIVASVQGDQASSGEQKPSILAGPVFPAVWWTFTAIAVVVGIAAIILLYRKRRMAIESLPR